MWEKNKRKARGKVYDFWRVLTGVVVLAPDVKAKICKEIERCKVTGVSVTLLPNKGIWCMHAPQSRL